MPADACPQPDARWRLRILDAADIAALQRFFDANPEYFLAKSGEPPHPNEAETEFHDVPPAGDGVPRDVAARFFRRGPARSSRWRRWSQTSSPSAVWHIGLFIVATALHGSGTARRSIACSKRWMVEQGALWIRLGVVRGNARAERFWERRGYVEVRERGPVQWGASRTCCA